MNIDKDIYNDRFYRQWMGRDDLERYQVKIAESDLLILSDQNMESIARKALIEVRGNIERYIAGDREFATSLTPILIRGDVPGVITRMSNAGQAWDVGPMAAVAGAVAQEVGEELAKQSRFVIVENGGDVFVKGPEPFSFALYAGEESPFTDKVIFRVEAKLGLGVCTSSGLVGPSLSLGKADAVVAIARDAAFADAAATAIANRIQTGDDVDAEVNKQEKNSTLQGLIACCGKKLGIWGDIELVS